jgi:Putative metal-binding motif
MNACAWSVGRTWSTQLRVVLFLALGAHGCDDNDRTPKDSGMLLDANADRSTALPEASTPTKDGSGCATDFDCSGLTLSLAPASCARWECDSPSKRCVMRAVDTDMDGFRTARCRSTNGAAVETGADCDDSSANVHPGARETCDGNDEDCDGIADNNASVNATSCEVGVGKCKRGDGVFVCRDGKEACEGQAAMPMQSDAPMCDGQDWDCDGVVDREHRCACTKSQPMDCNQGDCNPVTVLCEGGTWDCPPAEKKRSYRQDADEDGFCRDGASMTFCERGEIDRAPSGWTLSDLCKSETELSDCDIREKNGQDRQPGKLEECNGIDDNCDNIIDNGPGFDCTNTAALAEGCTYTEPGCGAQLRGLHRCGAATSCKWDTCRPDAQAPFVKMWLGSDNALGTQCGFNSTEPENKLIYTNNARCMAQVGPYEDAIPTGLYRVGFRLNSQGPNGSDVVIDATTGSGTKTVGGPVVAHVNKSYPAGCYTIDYVQLTSCQQAEFRLTFLFGNTLVIESTTISSMNAGLDPCGAPP